FQSMETITSPTTTEAREYILLYASCEYAQFRFAEFVSLAGLFDCRFGVVFTGIDRERQLIANYSQQQPIWSDELFSDTPTNAGVHDWTGVAAEASIGNNKLQLCSTWWRSRSVVCILCEDEIKLRQVVKRSALIKSLLRVWQSTSCLLTMLNHVTNGELAPYLAEASSGFDNGAWTRWRMCIELVNVSAAMDFKVGIVDQFGEAGLDMPGQVDLKKPEFELYYLEHWRYDLTAGAVTDKTPVRVYLAPKLCSGQSRAALHNLSLSRRIFIGNTSMNVQLAFIMCNLARVSPGQLVVDPFVGSGSILVSAGYLGAYCLGQDVDYNIVFGLGKSTKAEMRRQKRTEDERLSANFAQYGISNRFVDCLVGDASQHVGLWRHSALFDTVLTDPPYGIRERSRKVKRDPDGGPKKLDENYFPPKEHYSLGDSVSDLLGFCAMRLVPGGRCVYWFPVIQSEYKGADSLPVHPCLQLIASVELPMTHRTARVMVCVQRLPMVDTPELVAMASNGATIVNHDHHQLRSSHYSRKK
uniref:tRNA (guanine(10)-N(2))-methyltransferase TRMT11 n=1 Tax=Macrostomum lignano TaxID=282301 RepID=A0A1I8GFF7_9PLAT